jgi:hypothetical protein
MNWSNRIPANRQTEQRWVEFCEVLDDCFATWIEPEVQRLQNLVSRDADSHDLQKRIEDFNARFLIIANHVAPEIASQQVRKLSLLKNTEELWKAYGRQLGFHEDDIQVENFRVDSLEEYDIEEYNQTGDIQTSRLAMALNLENTLWLTQPIASPANLLQDYANQTRPAHVVLEPHILQSTGNVAAVEIELFSGVEIERTCRISL